MRKGGRRRCPKTWKSPCCATFTGSCSPKSSAFYYDQDLSLGEIAENTGITRQGVRDSIKRGEATLLEMEEKLGLCRRYRQMYAGLERITQEAKQISLLNDNYNSSAEIERAVRVILDTVKEIGE